MKIQDRFLKYVSFPTNSDEKSKTVPSTKKQLALAEYLAGELSAMGLDNVHVDYDSACVYAFLKGNRPCRETVGFIAHMDTSPEAPDENIKPRVVRFDGNAVCLNEEKNIMLSPEDYPNMLRYVGDDVIVTDGTTLLGADNKAGMAEIITAVEYIIENDVPHGNVSLCFTPDEEINRGVDKFDIEKFGADYAYTVDGSTLGIVEYENFNAARAIVNVKGINIHTGCAKGKMINASSILCELDSMLPKNERPETTEGYEGFYHLLSMSGNVEAATGKYILRDHDKAKLEQKKQLIRSACDFLNGKYGAGTCSAEITDSYSNMSEVISEKLYIVDRARAAIEKNGIKSGIEPIRGGTDGVKLSFRGLPCPNLCTGAENYHSRFEYVSIQVMEKVSQIIVTMINDLVDGE